MRVNKEQENKTNAVKKTTAKQEQTGDNAASQFEDNRPEAMVNKELLGAMHNSPRTRQLKAVQKLADNSSRTRQALQLQAKMQSHTLQKTAQLMGAEEKEEEPLQARFEPVQQAATGEKGEEEEETMQGKFEPGGQTPDPGNQKPDPKNQIPNANNTGMPDTLKSGIENLSGYSMNDVKVHYNSDKPAQLQAHAYAQGNEIHLGPGQEKHLPHEAWHVVQQKQGRVKPTKQLKSNININDDSGLEKEADAMGSRAMQMHAGSAIRIVLSDSRPSQPYGTIQRLIINNSNNSFDTELREPQGWIIGAGIYAAMSSGGKGQKILDWEQVNGKTKLGANENIYLLGHGEKGQLGDLNPHLVSEAINQFLPENYAGQIISLSCYAGSGKESAVESLAGGLNKGGVMVSGAKGMALNSEAYGQEKEFKRVITEEFDKEKEADKIIEKEIGSFGINDKWAKYISTWKGDLKEAATKAHEISQGFYKSLEKKLDKKDLLLDKKKDTTKATSPEKKSCYLTTACTQFKGLPDDCDELTTLRHFRDTFLRALPDGDKMVNLYYNHAPFILAGIEKQKNKKDIYEELYKVIRFCVKAVKEGKNKVALDTYKNMVELLNDKYGNLVSPSDAA